MIATYTKEKAIQERDFQNENGTPHAVVKVTYWDGRILYFASKVEQIKKSNFITQGYAGCIEII